MVEQLTKELYEAKAETIRIKRHLLAIENDCYRMKIRMNADVRRKLKAELKKINEEIQPPLPF